MKITRMYTGPDGQSHFEDREIPLRDTSVGRIYQHFRSQEILFRETPAGMAWGYHTTRNRVLIVILTGAIEVELGDGTKRRFGPGELVLADDVTGQGHKTVDVEGPRQSLMITIPDDVSVDDWPFID